MIPVHLLRVEVNCISRTLANIGFILALIGSLFLIIIGIAGMLGIFVLIFAPYFALGSFFYGIVMFIVGLLGLLSSRFVYNPGAAIWMLILAVIAGLFGAVFAAWLLAIGGILGLLSRL